MLGVVCENVRFWKCHEKQGEQQLPLTWKEMQDTEDLREFTA